MQKLSVERLRRVYNDDTGAYLQIGPDSDGIGCLELTQVDSGGETVARILMSAEEARLLIPEIQAAIEELPT